ncbi:MAG: serine/threonine protein kinase [Myxococcales bacterium]|jgi:tRNA A-37 threonylcarbamoyl transferase component Bud32|nr:MAG: serine/threonine protein kinase [Myxococcales bacterium]
MTGKSRTASTIQRLRSRAGSRITEGLLSSNGKVAAIGLATAVLTLIFTIWFQISLRHQSTVGAPMVRAAYVLDVALNRSLAALRGWVAYGDLRSTHERTRVWIDEIEPTIATLHGFAVRTNDAKTAEQIGALEKDLHELKRTQWAIEDVARTPGNQPAAVEYAERLAPLRRSILAGLDDAIVQYSADASSSNSITFVADLAQFRSAFTEADLAFNELLVDYSDVRDQLVKGRLAAAQEHATRIAESASRRTDGDLRYLVDFLLEEFAAYSAQVQPVIALRRSPRWNVALDLFVNEAQPLAERAKTVSRELAEAQARASAQRADQLTRASYVVIAMALFMGLLSAGSLMVSFRLRRQVEKVMARAKTLGQYVIEGRLGKGGMGEVYLARHAMLRRPTAIKLLRAENAQNMRAQTRFQREVQLTCQLTHPNTIEIFDYGRTPEGIFYYAMEYLEGFTLQSLVSVGGPVSPARVVHILTQACGSLEEAHASDLLHRDIKPSNIMLTQRGGVYDTVKILDFGLVKDLSDSDAGDGDADTIAGTPMYLAPELILSSDAATPQADLYALGAVGYYLLTGTTVFPDGDIMELLRRHVEEQPELPSRRLGRELPEDLEYVILCCLAKDPNERPAGAAELAAMLHAVGSGVWTAEEARAWWGDFGEAAKADDASENTRPTLSRSGVEIAVSRSIG